MGSEAPETLQFLQTFVRQPSSKQLFILVTSLKCQLLTYGNKVCQNNDKISDKQIVRSKQVSSPSLKNITNNIIIGSEEKAKLLRRYVSSIEQKNQLLRYAQEQ